MIDESVRRNIIAAGCWAISKGEASPEEVAALLTVITHPDATCTIVDLLDDVRLDFPGADQCIHTVRFVTYHDQHGKLVGHNIETAFSHGKAPESYPGLVEFIEKTVSTKHGVNLSDDKKLTAIGPRTGIGLQPDKVDNTESLVKQFVEAMNEVLGADLPPPAGFPAPTVKGGDEDDGDLDG